MSIQYSANPLDHVRTRKRGKSWYYYFECASIGGKRQQKQKGGFATQGDALSAGCTAYELYHNGGREPGDGRMSFADYLDIWFERTKLYARNNTLEMREKNIRLHIKPFMGKYRLSGISPAVIEKFVREKRSAGYAFETVDRMLNTVRSALDYAIWPMEILKENPARMIKTPGETFAPLTRKEKRRRLEDNELTSIFKMYKPGDTFHMPFVFGLYFGARIGEVLGASWNLCNENEQSLSFQSQIQRLTMKGKTSFHYFCPVKTDVSRRTLRYDDAMAAQMREWKRMQKENELYYGADYFYNYLVPAKDFQGREILRVVSMPKCYRAPGKKIDLICTQPNGKYIKPCMLSYHCKKIRDSGIHGFDFHSLRHTNLTMLGEAGSTVNEIMARAGHSDFRTSQIYIDNRQEMQDRPVDILSHKLGKIIG